MRFVSFALECAGLWKISKMRFCKTVGSTERNVYPDKSQCTKVFSEPHIIFLTLREELVEVQNCNSSGSSCCDSAISESEICVGNTIGSTRDTGCTRGWSCSLKWSASMMRSTRDSASATTFSDPGTCSMVVVN